MKVVWYGFPGERTRSPAGSRNVNESCVASLVFSGVGGSGRRPSPIRRPRRACGELYRSIERSILNPVLLNRQGGGGLGAPWPGRDHNRARDRDLVSQEAISGPVSKSLSTIFKPTVQRRWSTFCTTALFSGSAAVAAGHLVCPTFEIRAGARAGAVGVAFLCTGPKDSRIWDCLAFSGAWWPPRASWASPFGSPGPPEPPPPGPPGPPSEGLLGLLHPGLLGLLVRASWASFPTRLAFNLLPHPAARSS